MVLAVLIVALTNLSLGFAAAVYLGRAQRRSAGQIPRPVSPGGPALETESPLRKAVARPTDVASTTASPDAPPAEDEISKQWHVVLDAADRSASFVEAATGVLRLKVRRYRRELIAIDRRVRQYWVEQDQRMIDGCLSDLESLNRQWLSQQQDAASHLSARREDLGSFEKLRHGLEQVLREQAAQMEATGELVRQLDFAASFDEACGKLIGQIALLLDQAHALRDAMHESLAAIVRADGGLGSLELRLRTDNLCGIANRAGLERIFHDLWSADPNHVRQISVALVDIDGLGIVNQTYGVPVGDRLIAAVAGVLDELVRKDRGFDVVARYSGQRFLVVYADTGPRAATSAAERIRQTVERCSFDHDGAELNTTLRCGVVEARTDDTTQSLLERAGQTLVEAKRAGGNQTFLHEGLEPTAIQPPDFEVRSRVVDLREAADVED